jgi:hypothetical protein
MVAYTYNPNYTALLGRRTTAWGQRLSEKLKQNVPFWRQSWA